MYYHVPVIAFVKRSGLSMSAIQVIFIIIIIIINYFLRKIVENKIQEKNHRDKTS